MSASKYVNRDQQFQQKAQYFFRKPTNIEISRHTDKQNER